MIKKSPTVATLAISQEDGTPDDDFLTGTRTATAQWKDKYGPHGIERELKHVEIVNEVKMTTSRFTSNRVIELTKLMGTLYRCESETERSNIINGYLESIINNKL